MIKSYRVTFSLRGPLGFLNLVVDHGHLLLEMCLLLLQVVRFGRQPYLLGDSELVVSPNVLDIELREIVEQVVVVIEDDLGSLIWLWWFNVLVFLLKEKRQEQLQGSKGSTLCVTKKLKIFIGFSRYR